MNLHNEELEFLKALAGCKVHVIYFRHFHDKPMQWPQQKVKDWHYSTP